MNRMANLALLALLLGCPPPSEHPCPYACYVPHGELVSEAAECGDEECVLDCDGTDACAGPGLWCESCDAIHEWLATCPDCVVTQTDDGVITAYCDQTLKF